MSWPTWKCSFWSWLSKFRTRLILGSELWSLSRVFCLCECTQTYCKRSSELHSSPSIISSNHVRPTMWWPIKWIYDGPLFQVFHPWRMASTQLGASQELWQGWAQQVTWGSSSFWVHVELRLFEIPIENLEKVNRRERKREKKALWSKANMRSGTSRMDMDQVVLSSHV